MRFLIVAMAFMAVCVSPTSAHAQSIPPDAVCKEGYLWPSQEHYLRRQYLNFDGVTAIPCDEPSTTVYIPPASQPVEVDVNIQVESDRNNHRYREWGLTGPYWREYGRGITWRIDPYSGRAYRDGYRDGQQDEERDARRDRQRENGRLDRQRENRRLSDRSDRDNGDRWWYRGNNNRDDTSDRPSRANRNDRPDRNDTPQAAQRGERRDGPRPSSGRRDRERPPRNRD